MDTLDKAAGLAEPKLADAVNKDWLLASGQSSCSRWSADLRRRRLADWSSKSLPTSSYGTTQQSGEGGYTHCEPTTSNGHDDDDESGWLLRHYTNNRQPSNLRKYSINGHLYDNISFADSPMLTRSLSRKVEEPPELFGQSFKRAKSGQFKDEIADEHEAETTLRKCLGCFGKFRIFLACYLLLGITLAIYSRNALSLAAVVMVANNRINKELVDILSSSSSSSSSYGYTTIPATNNSVVYLDRIQLALDGSCAVTRNEEPDSKPNQAALTSELNKYLPSDVLIAQASKNQLETAYRTSVRERIKTGELVDWTPSEQGLIFAAGSLGNLLIAIPITRLGEIYGPKWIIFTAVLGATIQAAFMPVVASHHVALVILFQIIFNGLTFGADCVAYTLFAQWLTPTEMAFFVACLLICYQMGTIISGFITAKILTLGIAWSWCFYTPAILCGLWSIVWVVVGASDPLRSWFISKRELNYLVRRSKIAQVACSNHENSEHSGVASTEKQQGKVNINENLPVCWVKLAKDPNIWAIIAVKFSLRWYFSAYIGLMPTYLSSVTHMSVKTIGNVSVFMSFVGLFSGILMSYMTKSLVDKRPYNLSLATIRKIFQSIVNFGLALSLLVFLIFDCNQWITIATLTISGICVNFYVAAALQLPLDLSPTHCGLITSITNTLAIGQAISAPISGLIVNGGPKDRTLWRIVWLVCILLNTLSGLLFIFLVDSKPRDYNKYPKAKQTNSRACSPHT